MLLGQQAANQQHWEISAGGHCNIRRDLDLSMSAVMTVWFFDALEKKPLWAVIDNYLDVLHSGKQKEAYLKNKNIYFSYSSKVVPSRGRDKPAIDLFVG